MARTGERVFLRIAVEVGQTVIVTCLQDKVADAGTHLHASSAYDAVIELTVCHLAVLLVGRTSRRVPVFAHVFALAYQVGYLRTQVQHETYAVALVLAESQMGKQRHFQVIHRTVIRIARTVLDDFFPTALGEVHFALNATNHAEIFLADVTHRHTECRTYQLALLEPRSDADGAEIDSSAHTQGKVMALVLQLGLDGQSAQRQSYNKE